MIYLTITLIINILMLTFLVITTILCGLCNKKLSLLCEDVEYFLENDKKDRQYNKELNEFVRESHDEVHGEVDNLRDEVQRYQNSVDANVNSLLNSASFLDKVKVGQQFTLDLGNGQKITLPLGIKRSKLQGELLKQGVSQENIDTMWNVYANCVRNAKQFDKKV